MKSKDLIKKDHAELEKHLEEKRNKIKEMRFKVSSGGIKNVKDFKESKKEIARILTILNQKKS
jgi:large subunit ribosomal protein L29